MCVCGGHIWSWSLVPAPEYLKYPQNIHTKCVVGKFHQNLHEGQALDVTAGKNSRTKERKKVGKAISCFYIGLGAISCSAQE